ncbi:hypothetical protein BJ138DRAFT_482425 [Hygrophoropsis aurantiaca]|uniref:Uncharacterized protein n=1 Tax=Hygrophoropsis aurantiaca TaxID=72124 RepID=A0ACB8A4N0_9AGAM|nr:hypothetical protein BJ138DRAFT_482425 [Hygrophoropsis aurantiaca]
MSPRLDVPIPNMMLTIASIRSPQRRAVCESCTPIHIFPRDATRRESFFDIHRESFRVLLLQRHCRTSRSYTAVELLVSLLQHPDGVHAPPPPPQANGEHADPSTSPQECTCQRLRPDLIPNRHYPPHLLTLTHARQGWCPPPVVILHVQIVAIRACAPHPNQPLNREEAVECRNGSDEGVGANNVGYS